ncbi:MAG: 50S ribosomal protein L15 [Planctomycetales bacterium]|nr:50S ribosomal protein L15 [Planctomycetales bacterium]
MKLHDVNTGITKHRKRRRIGRGPGSGHGKTSGRGHKGAQSRSGYSRHPIFQGGAMPLVRRVPKRGFNNRFAVVVKEINVGDLERLYTAGEEVNPDSLRAKSAVTGRYDVLKVLGDGQLTKKLTISAHRFSASAKAKIEQAGGSAVVIPGPTPVAEKNGQRIRRGKRPAAPATPAEDATPADESADS